MKTARIVIGVYQVFAAVAALMMFSQHFVPPNLGFAVVIILFCCLSFVAGVVALAWESAGWRLTLITQGFQIFGLFSPVFTFMVSIGFGLRFHSGLVGSTSSLMDLRLTVGFFTRAGGDFALAIMRVLDGFPVLGISLNVVPLAIAILAMKALKKPNQALQTTPVTPSVFEKTEVIEDQSRGV